VPFATALPHGQYADAAPQARGILVEFEPGARVGFLTLAELQIELSTLCGRSVDLVPKSGLKPTIRDEVIAQSRVLCAA